MDKDATLGLENLAIEKPPGKPARHRRRAKKAQVNPVGRSAAAQAQSKNTLNQGGIIEEACCAPAVPSYQSLPIAPLVRPANHPIRQSRLPLNPHAYRNTSNPPRHQPPQGHTPSTSQSACRYLPGHSSTPPNGFPIPAEDQVIQTRNRSKSGAGPTVQKSSLHSKAHPSAESTAAQPHRWTGSPPKDFRQSLLQPPKTSHPKIVELSPCTFRSPSPLPPYSKDLHIHLPAPSPSPTYITLADATPTVLPSPQRLLLVLDLNGTLLYRPRASTQYTSRPYLKGFLAYASTNHSLLIWSSATPRNVKGLCEKLFTHTERRLLLGEWGRNTLDLTPDQYRNRVQVYKRLNRIWDNETLQYSHPDFDKGERWGQHNTLLIDDSMLKASAQPFNHVEVPEFVQGGDNNAAGEKSVLAQVVGYLEEARKYSDVSGFVRQRRFGIDQGWRWAWKEDRQKHEQQEEDDEGGGVKLHTME